MRLRQGGRCLSFQSYPDVFAGSIIFKLWRSSKNELVLGFVLRFLKDRLPLTVSGILVRDCLAEVSIHKLSAHGHIVIKVIWGF